MKNKNAISSEIVFMIIMTALLVIRDLGGVQVNKYILVALVVAYCIMSEPNSIAVVECFLMPLYWGLPFTWFTPLLIGVYLFKQKNTKSIVWILFIFFVVAEVLASFWYPNPGLTDKIKYLSVLLVYLSFLYDDEVDYLKCVNAFYYGLIVLCAVITIRTIMDAPADWLSLFVKGWFRFGDTFERTSDLTLILNANSLAYYSLIGVDLSLVGIELSRGIKKILYMILIVFFALVGLFTVSRSWTIFAALSVIVFFAKRAKGEKSIVQTGIIAMVTLLLIVVAFGAFPELRDGLISRWSSKDVMTGNNRTTIISLFFSKWTSHPRCVLIGTGVTQYRQVLGTNLSMHNMLQQILVVYGIIGGTVFLSMTLYPLTRISKEKSIVLWMPVIGILLFTQTIQFVNPEALMLPYVIGYYVLKVPPNEEIYNNC